MPRKNKKPSKRVAPKRSMGKGKGGMVAPVNVSGSEDKMIGGFGRGRVTDRGIQK